MQVANDGDGDDSETTTQSERRHSAQSTLRSRFHRTPATNSTQTGGPQSSVTEPQAGVESSSSQDEPREGLMSIRLINSNETRTVRVARNTTLQELRR